MTPALLFENRRRLKIAAVFFCGFLGSFSQNSSAQLSNIFSGFEKTDKTYVLWALEKIVEVGSVNDSIDWENPKNGNHGVLTLTSELDDSDGRPCADFERTLIAGANTEKFEGTICNSSDDPEDSASANWNIVKESRIENIIATANSAPEGAEAAENNVQAPENFVPPRTALKPAPRKKLIPDQTVREVQALLNQSGYNAGPADGLMGRKTRQAIKSFQQSRGLPADGRPSTELLAQLRQSPPTQLPITPQQQGVPTYAQRLQGSGTPTQPVRPGYPPQQQGTLTYAQRLAQGRQGSGQPAQPIRPGYPPQQQGTLTYAQRLAQGQQAAGQPVRSGQPVQPTYQPQQQGTPTYAQRGAQRPQVAIQQPRLDQRPSSHPQTRQMASNFRQPTVINPAPRLAQTRQPRAQKAPPQNSGRSMKGLEPIGAVRTAGCGGIEVVGYAEKQISSGQKLYFVALRNTGRAARIVKVEYIGGRNVLGKSRSGRKSIKVKAGDIANLEIDFSLRPPKHVSVASCL